MSEIQNLTDQVLRNKLKEIGVNCGPIGKLRKTYEKRLFKAVNGHEYGKPATTKTSSTPAKKSASPGRKQNISRATIETSDTEIVNLSKRKKSPARKVADPPKVTTPARQTTTLPEISRENFAVNLESLSNAEIRQSIQSLGGTCGPINTPVIRKVMIKKLQKLKSQPVQSVSEVSTYDEKNLITEASPAIFKRKSPRNLDKNLSAAQFSSEDDEPISEPQQKTKSPEIIQKLKEKISRTPKSKPETEKPVEIVDAPADFSATEDELELDEVDSRAAETPWGKELNSSMQLREEPRKSAKVSNYREKRRSYARLAAGMLDTSGLAKKETLLERNSPKTIIEKPSIFSKFVKYLPLLVISAIVITFVSIFIAAKVQTPVNTLAIPCNSDDPSLCNPENSKNVEKLLISVHSILENVAGLKQCGKTNQNPRMDLYDVVNSVGEYTQFEVQRVLSEFLRKQDYGVVMFTSNGEIIESQNHLGLVTHLEIVDPSEHPKCRWDNLAQKIVEATWNPKTKKYLTVILICLTTISFIKYKLTIKRARQKRVQGYIQDILDSAENKYRTSKAKYIAVNHLRDNLISLDYRNKFLADWNTAVESIRNSESRIQFNQKMINGEPCEVIEWVCDSGPIFSKMWHGNAINKQGARIEASPQKCTALKIREFYVRNEDVETEAKKENLLKELMGQANLTLDRVENPIFPIHCSFVEGCCYIRFGSENDAVDFYNAINAVWYDGRLLTPKFIMDNKYFLRFPDAKN